MANDIQIIMEILGAEDMVKASKATQALENKLKLLSTQLAKGKLTWSQYMTGVNQLVSKNAKLAGGFRALQPEVMKFSSSLIKSNNQLQTAKTQVDRLTVATNNLSNAQVKSSAVAQINTRRMSSKGVAIQQAGYQVGDFLVQVQSGQNAMVAFGQQATQLVGVLPMVAGSLGLTMNAAIGLSTALGIFIPLVTAVGAYFMRTKEASDKATNSLGDFTSALDSVNSASEISSRSIEDLREEYGRFAEQVKETSRVVAQAALADAMRSYEKSAETLAGGLGKVSGAMDAYSKQVAITKTIQDTLGKRTVSNASAWDESEAAVEKARESLSAAAADMGVTAGEAELLQRTLDNMAKAKGLDEVATQASLALLQFDKMFTSSSNIPPEIALVISALRKMQTESARAAKDLDQADSSAGRLASGMDRVGERARNAARGVMSILGALRATLAELSAQEAGIAAARRTLGRGGSEADVRATQAGATVEAQLSAQGVEGPELQSAVAQAIANERKRLQNEANERSIFDTFNITGGGGGGGGAAPKDEAAEAIIKLQEQLTLQEALVGKTEAQRQVVQALGVDYEKIYGPEATDAIIARIEALKAEEEQIANIQSVANTMKSSMSDAFMSMIEGTKSFKDSMKDMARAVIKQLLEVLVVQKLVGSFNATTGVGSGIVGAVMGAFQADGGAWQGGSQIKAYANGGVVGGPTYFPMSGGKTGLMGEAGPEAIMPLKRGANGKLGVQMEGGGGDNVNIVQNFSFQANGDDSVKKLIAQAAPKIAQMTKSSMLDDRRRGGQTKSVFG